MLRIAIALLALPLAACQPPIQVKRADGRPTMGNAELTAQLEKDAAICKGEGAKAKLSAAGTANTADITLVQEGCMVERGYVIVRPGS